MRNEQTVRAFIAAMLPPDVRDALMEMGRVLAQRLGSHQRALKWVRPEGLHLTFHFEAALPLGAVQDVGRAMGKAAAGCNPFSLQVSDLGAFPGVQRPRVIWAGVEGELERLAKLAQAVEREVKAIGLTPDKPFKPHLTLARVRQGAGPADLDAISKALLMRQADPIAAPPFTVEELTLVRSLLDPGGSIYSPLGTAKLKGGIQ
jgi:2'-5' RNA ligase